MKPSLQVRLSQHLALTPQLQQSIRLLQLSTLELHQEVEQMLEANPFLERERDGDADRLELPLSERLGATDSAAVRQATPDEDGSDGPLGADASVDHAESPLDQTDWEVAGRVDWENGTEGDDFDGIRETPLKEAGRDGSSHEFDVAERNSAQLSLQEHLRGQLKGMRLGDEDAASVMVLIESLNEDGYLDGTLEEIAHGLVRSLGWSPQDEASFEQLMAQLRCGLKWLQSLEPTGVGARDLSECLVLQLRALPPSDACRLAMTICAHHLEILARRDGKKLMAATGASAQTLQEAHALILRCEPKPGRSFIETESQVVVPDVIVRQAGRGWQVVLNPDVIPKLRINEIYAQCLKGQRGAQGAAQWSSRLQEAKWFVKNILQRFETIQRVSEAIVERQKIFFSHGEIAMKPLVLREIADELGLHESTISRVTTAKYMATPFGTFELKYFFGSSLNTDAGGNASSTAVRALIKQLVTAEDPRKPLSDNQLSQMLEEQGIQVARRTVAKYRESLKIASANLRRAL